MVCSGEGVRGDGWDIVLWWGVRGEGGWRVHGGGKWECEGVRLKEVRMEKLKFKKKWKWSVGGEGEVRMKDRKGKGGLCEHEDRCCQRHTESLILEPWTCSCGRNFRSRSFLAHKVATVCCSCFKPTGSAEFGAVIKFLVAGEEVTLLSTAVMYSSGWQVSLPITDLAS